MRGLANLLEGHKFEEVDGITYTSRSNLDLVVLASIARSSVGCVIIVIIVIGSVDCCLAIARLLLSNFGRYVRSTSLDSCTLLDWGVVNS